MYIEFFRIYRIFKLKILQKNIILNVSHLFTKNIKCKLIDLVINPINDASRYNKIFIKRILDKKIQIENYNEYTYVYSWKIRVE